MTAESLQTFGGGVFLSSVQQDSVPSGLGLPQPAASQNCPACCNLANYVGLKHINASCFLRGHSSMQCVPLQDLPDLKKQKRILFLLERLHVNTVVFFFFSTFMNQNMAQSFYNWEEQPFSVWRHMFTENFDHEPNHTSS